MEEGKAQTIDTYYCERQNHYYSLPKLYKGVGNKMKEYLCIQVNHHKKIDKVTQEYLVQGWRLHTYQATGIGTDIKHYLLFERG